MTAFTQTLQSRELTVGLQRQSLKWFRYYWDFCAKYQLDPRQVASLNPFLEKLKVKKQTSGQQAETKWTIELFLQMFGYRQGRPGEKLTSNEMEMIQIASAGYDFEVKVSLSEPEGENRQIAKVAASGEVLKQITESNPILSVKEISKVYEPAVKIVKGKVSGTSWVGEFSRMGEVLALRALLTENPPLPPWMEKKQQIFTMSKSPELLTTK